MLTRFKVTGFKNLIDIDLRLGFFTCIAGINGVGKSNLFDAIKFLSDLASMPIAKAASLVRGANTKSATFAHLFGDYESDTLSPEMEFVAECVVPSKVVDDYSQQVSVKNTCLEYTLGLRLVRGDSKKGLGDRIEITKEHLRPRKKSAVEKEWRFSGSEIALRHVKGARTNPFIETSSQDGIAKIYLRSDAGSNTNSGAPLRVPLTTPRTVLSGVDSENHASHLAMRREMEAWKLLQLEPSALREPDTYNSESKISYRGEHLPSALQRIQLNGDIAADLSRLVRGVNSIQVVENDLLQLRSIAVSFTDRTYPASALSDGTLRFMALSIMACDPESSGLVCMEEPENGIHPTKIPEMIDLVRKLSDYYRVNDEDFPDEIPLRQVLINTHSPLVAAEVDLEELLFAQTRHRGAARYVQYCPLANTWRKDFWPEGEPFVQKGEIESFLSGVSVHHSPFKRNRKVGEWINELSEGQVQGKLL
jgi:predicted ATPase